jgi:hypothetical protein
MQSDRLAQNDAFQIIGQPQQKAFAPKGCEKCLLPALFRITGLVMDRQHTKVVEKMLAWA